MVHSTYAKPKSLHSMHFNSELEGLEFHTSVSKFWRKVLWYKVYARQTSRHLSDFAMMYFSFKLWGFGFTEFELYRETDFLYLLDYRRKVIMDTNQFCYLWLHGRAIKIYSKKLRSN